MKIEQVCQTVLFLADAKNTSECFQTFKNTKSFLVDRTGAVRRRISEEEDASGLNAPLFLKFCFLPSEDMNKFVKLSC